MDVDEDDEDGDFEEWECEELMETVDKSLGVLFSQDGRYYLKARGAKVFVYSTAPPYSLVSTLASHSGAISAFSLHPRNPHQLLTASSDGTIKVWDWVDSALIRTIDVSAMMNEREDRKEKEKKRSKHRERRHKKVAKMIVGLWEGKPVVWATVVSEAKRESLENHIIPHELVRISIRGSSVDSKSSTGLFKLAVFPRSLSSLTLSPRGTYLLATAGPDAYILTLATGHWAKFFAQIPITTAAWCPIDGANMPALLRGRDPEWFVTGDARGQVKLWQGLQQALASVPAAERSFVLNELPERSMPVTTLHWHAHAVSALGFTSTGAQILSTGEESVLVTWQVETLKKSFLARLGGSGISNLSLKEQGAAGEEEEYWLGLNDGTTVRIGSGSSKVTEVGKTARLDPSRSIVDGTTPLAYHTPSSSLVLPSSHPSVIQFYQPSTSSVLFDLEVSPSNQVSKKEDKALEPVRVESVVFCADNGDGVIEWMATSETRDGDSDAGGGKARGIKIWQWANGTYVLNTHLDRAHGFADITSMTFTTNMTGPSTQKPQQLLMTTAEDGSAKIWTIKRGTTISSQSAPSECFSSISFCVF